MPQAVHRLPAMALVWNSLAGAMSGGDRGRAVAAARIAHNMHEHGFADVEIKTFTRAYSGGTKQDLREAFWIFDRKRHGEVPCTELEGLLVELLGVDSTEVVRRQMRRVVVSVHAEREERRATMRRGGMSVEGAAADAPCQARA